MSPPKVKPRTSILKKRPSEVLSQSPEPTSTFNDKSARKAVVFTNKHTVKEFIQLEEKVETIWGVSYETSIGGRSEGSTDDGTHTFKKLRMDFSCSSMQTTSDAFSIADIDKENNMIPPVDDEHRNFLAPRAASAERQKGSLDSMNNFETSSSYSTSSSGSLDNLTVHLNPGEKKRVTKFGTDNLNITTHMAHMDISLPIVDDRMVLSPRKTMFNHAQFSIGLQDKVLVKKSEATKENVFVDCSIDMTLESGEASLLNQQHTNAQQKGAHSSRTTIFGSLMEQTLMPPARSPARNIRSIEINETLVTADRRDSFFDLEIEETLSQPKASRDSVFDLEVETFPQSKRKSPSFDLHVDESYNNVSAEMDITLPGGVVEQVLPHGDSRKTLFYSEIDETIVTSKPKDVRESIHELEIEEPKPTTIQQPTFEEDADESYASAPMDITLAGFRGRIVAPATRKTFYNGEIDETLVSNRRESRDITLAGPSDRIVPPSRNTRQTIYNSEIDETLVNDRRQSRFDVQDEEPSSHPEEINVSMEVNETRMHNSSLPDLEETSVGNNSMTSMILEGPEGPSSTSKLPSRSRDTIYNDDLSFTCTPAVLETLRREAQLMNCTKISDGGLLETTNELAEKADRLLRDPMATGSTGNLFEKSIQEDDSMTEAACPLRRIASEMYDRAMSSSFTSSDGPWKSTSFNEDSKSISMDVIAALATAPSFRIDDQRYMNASTLELKSEANNDVSINVDPGIATSFNIEDDYRQLIDEAAGGLSVEVTEDIGIATAMAPWRPTTFSVLNGSQQLMNVTAADFTAMLEDTSNPCMSEVSGTDNSLVNNTFQVSFGENTSQYQRALQDFVNITIMNSPLDQSTMSPRPTGGPVKIKPVKLEAPVDYRARMEDFMTTLKKKEVEPPKTDMDEYLEKLNIQPITIKMPEIFQPDYFEKRLAAQRENLARERREQKAQEEALKKSQQPEIPLQSFLIKNKIACSIDEEARKEFKKNQLAVPPIFPENRDFDFLFRNKFETDRHLSDYWRIDLTFSWVNQFKIYHKMMPAFTINFSVRNPNKDLDNSTLPVYFDKAFMYNSHFYSGTLGRRLKLHKSELKRSLGTEIFSDICTSMNDLPSFLVYYHSHVMKAVALVDNFNDIIVQNGAIIEAETDSTFILKRHFSEHEQDYIDVKILLYHYIEDIGADEVTVTSSTAEYFYEMQPRQGISKLQGLMLIETVLFDVEKFVLENSRRVRVPQARSI